MGGGLGYVNEFAHILKPGRREIAARRARDNDCASMATPHDALLAASPSGRTSGRTSGRGNRVLKLQDGASSLEYSITGRCGVDDPVIFLLHGVLPTPRFANALALSWYFCGLRQPESLPYKLIVLTRRGYGRSSDVPDRRAWSYRQFAEELIALADAEHAESFIVVGHSSGGPCALACAAHFPHRVAACGLLASDAPYPAPDGEYIDPLACMPPDALPAACGRCCPDGLYNDFGVERRPYSFSVAQVDCPTLLLVGRLDWAVGTRPTRWLAERIRHATLQIVTCAEHVGVTYSSTILEPFLRELVALAKPPRAAAATSAGAAMSQPARQRASPAVMRAPSPATMRRRPRA